MMFKLGIFVFGVVSGSDNCSRRHSGYNDYVATAALNELARGLVEKTSDVDALFSATTESKCRDDVCEVFFSLKKKWIEEVIASAGAISRQEVEPSQTSDGELLSSSAGETENDGESRTDDDGVTQVSVNVHAPKPMGDPKKSAFFTPIDRISTLVKNQKDAIDFCSPEMREVVAHGDILLNTLVSCNEAKREFDSVVISPLPTQCGAFIKTFNKYFEKIGRRRMTPCIINVCKWSYEIAAGLVREPTSKSIGNRATIVVEFLKDLDNCDTTSDEYRTMERSNDPLAKTPIPSTRMQGQGADKNEKPGKKPPQKKKSRI